RGNSRNGAIICHLNPRLFQYGIVLDAGSSHTSMYIYKWPADKQNGTGIVTQHDECDVKGPGISSYAGLPGRAAKSLEECLQTAVRSVPKARHSKTPLYLGATAGMRLKANASESQRVLKEVGAKLKSYPFSFKGSVILSGQEEGAYGWVTVNYLLENFAKYGFVGRWLNPGKGAIGALDLGGASTQITFQTDVRAESTDTSMNLTLYGQNYQLYTHSFLCYGQDQFLRRLLAHLINCVPSLLPPNFTTSVILGKDVFSSSCTEEYKTKNIDLQKRVTLVGTGHPQNCLAAVQKMFSFDKCNFSKCSFDGIYQPAASGKFMAFSAFYFSSSYVKALTNISDPRRMKEASQRVCDMSITEVRQNRGCGGYNVCAVANFIQVLLRQGYGFNDSTLPMISFERKAGGASVGWSLGYMLSLTSHLPKESVSVLKAIPSGPWSGLVIIFTALLLMGLVLLVLVCRKARAKMDLV
uniref:Ectonucleoside triphosphate diphosphohydrolase 2a, tandem duplicate 2 n=1 Tax=Neogobius melanostomus TaxID=47308 RepID=A0A8C6WNG0_9GOBI